jgi:hypothetical protein
MITERWLGQQGDTVTFVSPSQSQKRYHEDIFGAVFSYGAKKGSALEEPKATRL